MTIEPISDHVCVVRKPATEQTDAGIIIPKAAQDPPVIGDVISVGPDVKQISEGDAILFARYTGVPCQIKDVEYLMMREEEVLGVVKGWLEA